MLLAASRLNLGAAGQQPYPSSSLTPIAPSSADDDVHMPQHAQHEQEQKITQTSDSANVRYDIRYQAQLYQAAVQSFSYTGAPAHLPRLFQVPDIHLRPQA